MNKRDIRRMERLAEKGQFKLHSVLSRTTVIVDFDIETVIVEHMVSLRNPRHNWDLDKIADQLRIHVSSGGTYDLADCGETDKILRRKFAEFVKGIDPKLFDQAESANRARKLEQARDNLRAAARTLVQRGGSLAEAREILDLMQVEQVQTA